MNEILLGLWMVGLIVWTALNLLTVVYLRKTMRNIEKIDKIKSEGA